MEARLEIFGIVYRLVSCDDGYVYVFSGNQSCFFTLSQTGRWKFNRSVKRDIAKALTDFVKDNPMY